MVHTCVVAGCRNRRTPGTALSFYRFPRDPERKQRWIAAVNREGWVLLFKRPLLHSISLLYQ
uniref:THAP domain-containing protein 1 n=1 Tax=Salarias fasciatus TaxID=181472 RepID=A0A672IUE4_SALFA